MSRALRGIPKFVSILSLTLLVFFLGTRAKAQQTGPVNVPRPLSDPSIHEGIIYKDAGYRKDVYPEIGILPASYDWFGGLMKAIGSQIKQFAADPTWLGYKSGQSNSNPNAKGNQGRLYAGYKGIGGKNVTDTAQLGTVCGQNPGDPYWVGYWRPGNIEFPPPYQIWHHQDDCYCRCGEMIPCPIPYYAGEQNWHRIGGGPATHHIACEVCFGYEAHIRKHDKYVGTDHGYFGGYPNSAPNDEGYQECLRQSTESYAASGPGGSPSDPTLFGF